jgi:hypothetical protein
MPPSPACLPWEPAGGRAGSASLVQGIELGIV